MRNTMGLGLTFAAAGFFAIAPALAQTGSTSSSSSSQSGTQGSQSSTQSSQSSRRGSQQPSTSSSESTSQTGQYGQTGQATTGTSNISASDRQFLTKAAEGDMAEVEMGKLAQERGSSQHVKDLGKQLAEDHQKSLDQIRSIAQNKGITLPSEVTKKDKAEYDKLSGLSGDAFDRAFLRAERQDHKRDIAEYKRQADRATDPDIKQYAQSTLPVLERHEHMSTQESATATGATTTTPRTDTEESATAGSKQKEKEKSKNKDWSEEPPKSSSSSSSSTNPR